MKDPAAALRDEPAMARHGGSVPACDVAPSTRGTALLGGVFLPKTAVEHRAEARFHRSLQPAFAESRKMIVEGLPTAA